MNTLNGYFDIIKDELLQVFTSIEDEKVNELVVKLADVKRNNGKVLGYAAGRMGLSLKAFIMRLNHIGINAYFWGETYTPPMNENDLFICCSNSGTTKSVSNILDIFKKKSNGYIISFVGNLESYIAKSSNLCIVFRTCNGGLNSSDNENKINSIQPMTTLTEQAMLILFDIIVLIFLEKSNININDTKKYHSNIE